MRDEHIDWSLIIYHVFNVREFKPRMCVHFTGEMSEVYSQPPVLTTQSSLMYTTQIQIKCVNFTCLQGDDLVGSFGM